MLGFLPSGIGIRLCRWLASACYDAGSRTTQGQIVGELRFVSLKVLLVNGWALGAAVSASALHAVGRGFESLSAHHP
jgi:hypothetical protein